MIRGALKEHKQSIIIGCAVLVVLALVWLFAPTQAATLEGDWTDGETELRHHDGRWTQHVLGSDAVDTSGGYVVNDDGTITITYDEDVDIHPDSATVRPQFAFGNKVVRFAEGGEAWCRVGSLEARLMMSRWGPQLGLR